jgi:hypothetical protein
MRTLTWMRLAGIGLAGTIAMSAAAPAWAASAKKPQAEQSQQAMRPAYAPANECWTDDGGARWKPCGMTGGGEGGGGGAGGGS